MGASLSDQLEVLLETWRATFDGALGANIEALGTTAAALEVELPEDGVEAAQAWCERATDTSATLLTPLLDLLGELFERVRPAEAARCLELAATRPPDPRVAAFALPYLARARVLPEITRRLDGSLLSAVERHGDLRMLGALEAVVERVPAPMQKRVRAARSRIQQRIVVAARQPRPVPISHDMRATGADLLAAIYEDPDDDARRLVYADWLLERDLEDPRGQLIAAQLHREATRVGTGRNALVRTYDQPDITRHAPAWYAAILPAVQVSSMVFEKGFLARCAIVENLKGVPSAVFGRPEWATVRELRVAHGFAYHPAMRALRSLTNVREHQLSQLGSGPVVPRLDRIEVVLAAQQVEPVLAVLDRTPVHTLAIVAAASLELTALVSSIGRRRYGREVRELEILGDRPRWGVSRSEPWTTGSWNLPLLERSTLQRVLLSRDRWGGSRLELLRDAAGWSRARVYVEEARTSSEGLVDARAVSRAWGELLGFLAQDPVEELEIVCLAPLQLGPEHPVRQLAERGARSVQYRNRA